MSYTKEILIHIGYHKTASTWFQKKLFASESSSFEPLSDKKVGSSSLAKHFIYGEDGYCLSSFDQNRDNIDLALNKILDGKSDIFKDKIPVLSHGGLSGNPHSGGFDACKIASMLKVAFPIGRVLVLIREQNSFILSVYFQYLQAGGRLSLVKYLNSKYDGKRPCFSPNHINYVLLVAEYHRLFGKENVLVLPYEMFKSQPKEFIVELGLFMGTEIDINDNIFREKVNQKKHHFVKYHLRFLNVFRHRNSLTDYSRLRSPNTKKITEYIVDVIGESLPDSLNTQLKYRLMDEISQFTENRYGSANKKLSKMIGIDLSKYGYSN